MNKSNDILNKIDRLDGMTVPDGYFVAFAERMEKELPVRFEAENPESVILPAPTLWTRIRPYVYLAAMFAGVWCMLKMFSILSSPSDTNSVIDRNPILAEAISNDTFINEYIIDDINQWDIIDEMIEDGFDASSLEFVSDSDHEVNFIDPAVVNSSGSQTYPAI